MTRGPKTSLAVRITAICLAVAAVAVGVSGLVWNRLVTAAARDLAAQHLADQADTVAAIVTPADFARPSLRMPKTFTVLRGDGVAIVSRRPDGSYRGGKHAQQAALPILDDLKANQRVSVKRTVRDQELLVEARGVTDKLGFALVRPVELAGATQVARVANILIAAAIGLAVAALAGLLLAWLLARPLRSTVTVARQMRTGRRDLRATVAGPKEVADVADSVNQLADALQHSESRQREFLLSVSHELRTPLTTVKGFAESLADGVVTGDDVQRVGRTMSDESLRLERLVNDLLELARLGADEFPLDIGPVELGAFAAGCAEVWQARSAAERVDFRLELPGHPVVVPADQRRLRQVVDVLADNALRVLAAGAPLVLALLERPDAAILQVRDGGPGLSEEDYRVAFERGALRARYQGRRPVGSGVGLALAHGLVVRMGGSLQAGPAPEGGAAFTITLPLAH